ncbi:type VI secretion system Vgr family protein [Bremerella sp. T1]|uniref:type VI secretion system Vgr family protein n=1 Tax=Bremerella sp. TYQ1 TaxID=3119568 RepID=UPI001CCA0668|nr:type VI secretion system tip protein TssI/VgrG [Bremerella volcania]UBM33663.1 type VI secretion system tip protein VgrG [Bremerella volcania]
MNKAQENRAYTLEDQLGEDFYLLSFTGSEGISKLFSYQLHLASRRDDMQHKPEEILNKEAKLRFYVGDSDTRYVKGYINRFSSDYQPGVLAGFHAELVPWLWFLTQTSDCRIFEDKSIPDIIEDVFNSDPIKDIAKFERKLENNYPKLEYCVQYRETDFNFVSRLMEEAGIFYFFDFSGDGSNSNKLIMADNAQAYFDSIEKNPIQRTTSAGTHNVGPEILDWEHRYEFVAGKWTHSDHTFKEPYENFEKNSETKISNKLASDFKKYEMYDYPGNFVDSKSSSNGSTQSTDLSKVRIGEEEHPFDRVTGTSDCVSFAAGSKFTLNSKRVPADDSKTFAIISVQHSGSNPNYATGPAAGGKYTNSFTCVPESYVFNPPRTTPKPTVGGIQTATVIGPEGEEIHTDEHARIKCLFHWARPENSDRKKPSTQTSCWIRVAQASAGKKWGFLSIPRVGQEVVVDFLDGNPDRPLVVGSVYNSTQETAYKLPDDMAKTYFKTNSTPGGEGFNELFFDDKAEKERIFLHAQKDLDVRVLNDSRNRTFGNRSQIIGYEDKEGKRGGWQRELIYQDKEINVKRHQIEHIEGNHQMMVGHGDESTGGNIALVVEKSVGILIGSEGLEMTCEGDSKQHTEGDHELLVDGDIMQKSKNLHFTVDSSFNTSSNEISTSASTGIDIEAGTTFNQTADQTINIKGGMNVNIQAGASLSLSVGGNFISINPGGIFIQGTLVNINSGGSSTPAQAASTTTPTAPTGPEETVTKAAPTEPAMAHDEKTGFKSLPE